MCTPIGTYTGDVDKLQTKIKDFKERSGLEYER